MTHEPDQLLEEIRSRLAGIAVSLDDLDYRRGTLAAEAAGGRVATARQHVEALRSRLHEAEAELEGLRTAMVNRGVIERAKGMLMLRLSVDEATAFEHLRQASMRLNRRVVDVAADILQSRAGEGLLP
jgi:multidrug resistance efflux pump